MIIIFFGGQGDRQGTGSVVVVELQGSNISADWHLTFPTERKPPD